MQCSVGDTIDFVFKDYNGSHANPSLHLKAPSGIRDDVPCIALNNPAGAEFNSNIDTFMEPGRYSGSIEFGDENDPDVIVYSFPVWFQCFSNPAVRKWTHTEPEKVLTANASYTIGTNALMAYGDKIFAKVGNGIYTIPDGAYRDIPDSATGPIRIAYDSESEDTEITVTNIGASPYKVPTIEFYAYEDAPIGFVDDTEPIKEMRAVTIESARVSGVASLPAGVSKTCGKFDRLPDTAVTLYGKNGNNPLTVIKSGIPNDGSWLVDGSVWYMLNTNEPYLWVVVLAVGSATTVLNYDQVFARGTVYEEVQ